MLGRFRRRMMVRRRLLPRRIRRHPLVRVTVALVIVVVAWSLASRVASAAWDARRAWGETRVVYVARDRVVIGATLDSGNVSAVEWPSAVVPDDAVTVDPAGRVAVATIEKGEAVVAARLAPEGRHGLAALLPDGARAIAIATGPTTVQLTIGDRVDLIAGFDAASTANGDSPALVVAHDALVIGVDDQRVVVAVDEREAPAVAFALVAGTIVPVLRAT